MRSVDEYLSLKYRIRLFPDDEGDYIAEVEELPGCAADGGSPREAVEKLRGAMRAWLTSRLEAGLDVPEPRGRERFSGKFVVRMPKSLHAKLAREAQAEASSLNQYVVSLLSSASANRADRGQAARPSPFEGNVVVWSGQKAGWPALLEDVRSSLANNVSAALWGHYLPAAVSLGTVPVKLSAGAVLEGDPASPVSAREVTNRDDRALVA